MLVCFEQERTITKLQRCNDSAPPTLRIQNMLVENDKLPILAYMWGLHHIDMYIVHFFPSISHNDPVVMYNYSPCSLRLRIFMDTAVYNNIFCNTMNQLMRP